MKMIGRRGRRHQRLAVDRNSGVHDFLLPFRRRRHRFRSRLMRQHRFDFGSKNFLVILEGRFAIAVVKQIRVHLHRLLLVWWMLRICGRFGFGYFSASLFRLASPTSKSLPTMLSRLMKTCIILDMNGAGPCISHVRLVASPSGSIVNSAVLWPSKGAKKSSLMTIFDGD